ncbi:TonB-dependent receptor [Sphingomonas aerophila]|uniref:Outer membrane receptor protein involved in Fe transport n=1 Tax=Sphingomonas aerophila TaxID=1344948 RepID=A0A7W9BBL4_9SPHN|nr:TonB-dependent receptor [Sphingomonas aerophila]MBB5714181.1 outer membrane receptor protein involved in Fe transport [Sphingomonas aerophila]
MRTIYLATVAATVAVPALAQDRANDAVRPETAAYQGAPIGNEGASDYQRDVVVTALKRQQTVQDVPASVSVLSDELLNQLNATDFSRVADAVPGVAFATTGPGNSQYIIRGIGGVGFVQSPTTGVYFDETPLQTRALRGFSQPDPQLFDVARVEVLRGPQGVLFGSSSMGGLVRIVSNQPDASKVAARAEGSVATVRDGGVSWDAKGMLNVPIVADTLALRLSGSVVRQGGWIDDLRPTTGNLTENQGTSRVRKDANWTKTGSVRGALRWTPTPSLAVTPSLVWQSAFSNADRPHDDVTFGKRARLKARYQDTFAKDEFVIGSLLVENSFDALGGLNLISNSSYLNRRSRLLFDVTAFDSPIIEETAGPGPGGRLFPTPLRDFGRTKQFTQEVRAVSDGSGPLQYVVGGVYRDLHQRSGRTITVSDLFGVVAPDPLGASMPPYIQDTTVRFTEGELAAFAELTYAIVPSLKVAAGARVFFYRQREASRRYGIGGVAGGEVAYDYDERNREKGVTPRFTLSYEPSRAATLYASYSQGFRTGGVNAPITNNICSPAERQAAGIPDVPPPYDSDRTDNYELGAKTSLWGGRLRVHGAAFAINWKDYQQAFQGACGINNATTISFTVNAGRVRSRGGELEVVATPIDGLELQAGGAFADATYRNDVPNLLLAAGSRVLDVPRWTWNTRGSYEFAIGPDLRASLFAAARHVGSSNSGFGEGEVLPRAAYTLVDATAGVRTSNGLGVDFFVTNLFDAVPVFGQEFTTSPGNTTATSYFSYLVGPPRTIGVRLTAGF